MFVWINRNNRTSSLFETIPLPVPDTEVGGKGYCSCDRNRNGSQRANCSPTPNLSAPNLFQCPNCSPVTSPLPTFLPLPQRTSRQASLYVDQDLPDFVFNPDQPNNFHTSSLVWPTASGITESQAKAQCQQALNSSQPWAECKSFHHLSDSNVKDCVLDVQISDGYDFLEAAVSAFLTECQTKLAENPANYITESNGKKVLKPHILSDVCSVFCLRHGRCVSGKCVCEPGYTGDNCDLLAGKGPELLQVRGGNGTCDVNQRPCRTIFLDVTNIAMTDTLYCAVTTRLTNITSSDLTVLHGQFLSSNRLSCPLPDTHGAAMTSFKVSVSSDAEVYSNWKVVKVYDSTCLVCTLRGPCMQLAHTCLIHNKCYQDGDINIDDDTKVCNVTSSTRAWTSKASTAQFPVFQTPVLNGPDSDFLLTCAVNTSADARPDTRFRVTWFLSLSVINRAILSADDTTSRLSLNDIPTIFRHSAQVRCAVESFYVGQSGHSHSMVSNIISLH